MSVGPQTKLPFRWARASNRIRYHRQKWGTAMSTYLIKSEEIAAMEGTSKTHFRNPNARRINKSLGDAAGLTGFGFHIIEVEPGHETTEHHLHHHEDECVFVLSGTATAVIGDEEFAIGQGDFIGYRKGGLSHSIRNTGSETLRCIVVGDRRPHDVCDYPHQNKRMYRNLGMPGNLVDLSDIEELGNSVGKK
jgi:uncharacterized cupin superfamily protein